MLPLSTIEGFTVLMTSYDDYCQKTEAENKRPVSFLGYLASLF